MDQRSSGRRREQLFVHDRLSTCNQLLEVGRIIVSEMNIDHLFQVIMDQTNRIMGCERSTVFLYDENYGELWSLVATGMEKNEIRMPDNCGIAGSVFQDREPLIINDTYNDSRFYADIDKESGFETRNILCIPLLSREGDCMGVLQSLNKIDRNFSPYDREILVSISHWVTVAVENAMLYKEVKTYSQKLEQTIKQIETLDLYRLGAGDRFGCPSWGPVLQYSVVHRAGNLPRSQGLLRV